MPPQPTHDPGGYLSLVSDLIPLYVRPGCDSRVQRYHWNEADHPREPAGRSEGGQFTDRGQSPSSQTSTGGQSPPGSGPVPARRPTPGGTALHTTSPARKSTRKRELAALPDIVVAGHPLHISALDPDWASRITQWSGQLNQLMADVERASDSDAEESAWARVDKDQIRWLLDQMNHWDRQFGQSSGRRLSDFVNAGGLIPRSLAVRLDSGSRFFDPEKLRRHLRTAPASATQPAATQSAAASAVGPEPPTIPQSPAPDNPAPSADKLPRKARRARDPIESPPKKRGQKTFKGLAPAHFTKLKNAISDFIGTDSPEHQAALEEMVPSVWREMNDEINSWNLGLREIVSNFKGRRGIGAIATNVRRGTDPDNLKSFDLMVDYALKEFPHIVSSHWSGEEGLMEALRTGVTNLQLSSLSTKYSAGDEFSSA